MFTFRFATTPGKRLVMPVSRTAGAAVSTSGAVVTKLLVAAAGAVGTGRPGPRGTGQVRGDATACPGPVPRLLRRSGPASSRLAGNRDLAVDDLLLVGVELGLDVVDLAPGGGVVDAAGLEVV